MNIFVIDPCPKVCAEYLDDVRANKMLLETAQILSTAIWMHGGRTTYKPTHKSNPSVIWASQTQSNYIWTYKHFVALCVRYKRDRGKSHKSERLLQELKDGLQYIPPGEMTEFANCAANKKLDISYKHIQDIHEAYKLYLNERWNRDTIKLTWHFKEDRP